ncbi:MAG: hypothetical protein IJQ31_14915 [Thermoguttaceae bacterium]|nr:hypothetical protein [Thermoguttaceae bacterium]
MPQFKDNTGLAWPIEIKVRDVERIKAHVTGANGQPVDLLAVAEQGDFSAISGSVEVVLKVVFWLCFDEIMANFDREAWDRSQADFYKMCPEEKQKTPLQKAADWFGSRIGGEQVLPLVKAWEEALLNFIPNPRVREAVLRLMDRETVYKAKLLEAAEKTALLTYEQNEEALGASSSNTPASSD